METVLPNRITAEFVAEQRPILIALAQKGEAVRLDGRNLQVLDGFALIFIRGIEEACRAKKVALTISGFSPDWQKRLEIIPSTVAAIPPDQAGSLAERVGNGAIAAYEEFRDGLLLLSESIYWTTAGLFKRKTLLAGETFSQMVRLGSSALPIVLLLSILIGFTLAMQTGLQLQKFGATLFLADGIGVSMVTEIGPVLTAVILAGRSGSAITAEIATMTVQEEIDALSTLAVNPIHFLVLPRFWALVITLPLLTVLSAAGGVFSGLLVGVLAFKLSIMSFLNQLAQAVTVNYVEQLLIKSATFAAIIAIVAITKGLRVRGGADAVGRATTDCVVTCIFGIILSDALFSFVFYF